MSVTITDHNQRLKGFATLIAVSLSGCSAEPPAGRTLVETEGPPLSASWMRTNDADPVGIARPELRVGCGDHGHSIQFELIQTPASPPPLREVFATLSIDGQTPRRIEMGWLTDSAWAPRATPDEGGLSDVEEQRLALAMVRARSVRLEGASGYHPGPITWAINLDNSQRRNLEIRCGAAAGAS